MSWWSPVNELRIRALGGLDIEVDGQPLSAPVPAKGRALLAYLAAVGGRADRSRLAGLLWSDLPEASARQNLRLVLTRLRRAIDHVQADRASVWLDGAWSADTLDAEAVAADASAADPEKVLDLVRGEFLDGFEVSGAEVFGAWVAARRAQLRSVTLGLLGDVVGRALTGKVASTAGIAAARRMLELEPADEAAHRALMQLFATAGQPSAALAQFDTCMHVLYEELGERPTEATAALADDIRKATTTAPPPTPATISPRSPRRSPSFVGRETELNELNKRFADPSCHLITIVGSGGVGKTRLAVEFARAWTDQDEQHTAAFVSFAGVTDVDDGDLGEAVITTLADALDIKLVAGRHPFDVLTERLATRPGLLLVVDNLEHLPGAGRILARTLDTAPTLQMLATSRRRLAIGAEWVLPLDGLEPPEADADAAGSDAVRLFVARAEAAGARATLDPDEVAGLCHALGGIPLAIELAARRAAAVSVHEIHAHLDRALDLLVGTADADDRHRSIRATLDWSYDLLDADVKRSFARLSVFPGGFTLSAADRVADVSVVELSELVEHSLLTLEPDGRYRLHPLVRRYAAEQADQLSSSDAPSRRHATWVAESISSLAERTTPDAATPGLDDERTATHWMVAHATNDDLASYLRNLADVYRRRSWWTELRTAAHAALARDDAPATQRAEWLLVVAEAYGQYGAVTDAAEVAWQALAALGGLPPESPARQLPWRLGRAATTIAWRLGFPRSNDRVELARRRALSLDRLAEFLYMSDQFDRLPPLLPGGVVESRMADDSSALAAVDGSVALIALHTGRTRMARRYRDRAVARLDDDTVDVSCALATLQRAATVSTCLGEWDDADRHVTRALDISAREGSGRYTDIMQFIQATARCYAGDYDAAASLARVILARASRRGVAAILAWAELLTAEIMVHAGSLDRAEAAARRGLELSSTTALRIDQVRALIVLGRVAVGQQRWDEAANLVSDADTACADTPVLSVYLVDAHAGVPELALDLLESDHTDAVNLDAIVGRGLAALRPYAAGVPIAQPRLHLAEARRAQLDGRYWAARRAYDRAARTAQRLGMPWEAQEAARRRDTMSALGRDSQ